MLIEVVELMFVMRLQRNKDTQNLEPTQVMQMPMAHLSIPDLNQHFSYTKLLIQQMRNGKF